MPEFAKATQPPYALIEWLLDAKAIEQHDLDEQGIEVTDEQKAGKSEDEIDDLVADYAFQTNEVGLAVIAEFKPLNRLAGLLESVPERYDTYREVLEFLRVRRSMLEVDNLLRGRDILMSGRNPDDRPMQPSVFIDKLAAAGAILYNEGWQLSIDGEEFLAAIEKEERGA
jgi:hypothetical protein